jgi:hypothetical protein
MKKIAFISSPYSALTARQRKKHIKYAREMMYEVIYCTDNLPIVPHLLYPQVLDDNDENQRITGLNLCKYWIEKVDVIYVCCRYGISKGMAGEIKYAKSLNKEIIYIDKE